MKKLIILTAALLLGVGSVLAQGNWEVKAEWSIDPNSDCLDLPSQYYGFQICLTIYDIANEEYVVQDECNTEDWGETSTIFTAAQTQLQAYCNDSHSKTPSLNSYIIVRIYHLTTYDVECSTHITENRTCAQMSDGETFTLYFD